jgi:carbonic anhydrase/acetyltransferase-like protein (isoleucine patch superfamily)
MRPINRDTLPHLVSTALNIARERRDTVLSQLLAWWWGIDLGSGCRFYGLPTFRRIPSSSILIGKGCAFRSAPWSNQVGLNRACMLSTLREGAEIAIGESSGFSGTVIGAAERIAIGPRVLVGGNCTITDTDWHPIDAAARMTDAPAKSAPVVIEADVFLSMNVTVLKGVTIGEGTVVAANSVVSRSLPAGVIAGGAPANVLKKL